MKVEHGILSPFKMGLVEGKKVTGDIPQVLSTLDNIEKTLNLPMEILALGMCMRDCIL